MDKLEEIRQEFKKQMEERFKQQDEKLAAACQMGEENRTIQEKLVKDTDQKLRVIAARGKSWKDGSLGVEEVLAAALKDEWEIANRVQSQEYADETSELFIQGLLEWERKLKTVVEEEYSAGLQKAVEKIQKCVAAYAAKANRQREG
ncbi:hypothetical protein BGX38DRAFT_1328678 [Terfezia claveryi]|nr:hypothetical protein BGX38DRAFT_1328678 [Terfezia claveryi]